MQTHILLPYLAATLACCTSLAQGVQNMDTAFMAGPASSGSRVLRGSDVTLNGRTSFGAAIVYGYQVTRMSAASLWIEVSPGTFVLSGLATASIPGVVNNNIQAYTAAARVMLPLQSRVSAYGVLGGGGGSFNHAVLYGGPNPFVTSYSSFHGVFLTGGGIDVRLTPRVSIRGEVRDLVTGKDLSGAAGRNHLLPLFGIAFHF